MTESIKARMSVIQGSSIRSIVEQVNKLNSESPNKILKEDIITILHDDGAYFLFYFR